VGLADSNPSKRIILTDDQAREQATIAATWDSGSARRDAATVLLASHEEQARRIKTLEKMVKQAANHMARSSRGTIELEFYPPTAARIRAALARDTEQDEP
jgi:hypothetical protein